MNNTFQTYKKLLVKELGAVFTNANKASVGYTWSKDAIKRLQKFAIAGKLVRGSLVVLAADSGNQSIQADAVKVGSALELMHSGILIHDDIMDRDAERRGQLTVHTQYSRKVKKLSASEQLHYGESLASCVAIVAYFLSMGQLGLVKKSQAQLVRLFSREMVNLGFAQMDDVDMAASSNKPNITKIHRIYVQKTGRYTFALPLLAGFHLAGKYSLKVEQQTLALAECMGVIFQLRDDILGVFGNPKQTGKSVGGDIRERKLTWLYYKTLEKLSGKDKKRLQLLYNQQQMLTSQEQKWVLGKMVEHHIDQLAEQELLRQQVKAVKLSRALPFSDKQQTAFESLIDYLMVRIK